jgi:protein AroM
MHSVGYTETMARRVARVTGRPVVTARRVIAGAIRPHARRPLLLNLDRTSGEALLARLPTPAN